MTTTFTICPYFPEAECDYSGATGEAVEVTSSDGALQKVVLSFNELKRHIRRRYRQEERLKGHGQFAPLPEITSSDHEDSPVALTT